MAWNEIIVNWTNCLAEAEELKPVRCSEDLDDGKLLYKLINLSTPLKFETTLNHYESSIISFLREEYPKIDLSSVEDIYKKQYLKLLVLSRLAQEPCFHEFMCTKLNLNDQIKIKMLLEVVFNFGKNLTIEKLHDFMSQQDLPDPKTPYKTPKKSLENFLKSPGTPLVTSTRKISEYSRKIRCLKIEVENERYEKLELQEDLRMQQARFKELENKLKKMEAEFKSLQILNQKTNDECSCDKENYKFEENNYIKEIESLEILIEKYKTDNINLQEDKSDLTERIKILQLKCKELDNNKSDMQNVIDNLLMQLQKKVEEINELKRVNDEFSLYLKEKSKMNFNNYSFEADEPSILGSVNSFSSLNRSETLSSVIDVQLQEARRDNDMLKNQLKYYDKLLTVSTEEYIRLKSINQKLEIDASSLQKIISDCTRTIEQEHKQLLILMEENREMDSRIKHLENIKDSNRKNIYQLEQKIHSLESQEQVLNRKIGSLQNNIMQYKKLALDLKNQILDEGLFNIKLDLPCTSNLTEFESIMNDNNKLLMELKERLNSALARENDLQVKNNSLECDLSNVEKLVTRHLQELSLISDKCHCKEQEVNLMSMEIDGLKNEIAGKENTLSLLTEVIESAKNRESHLNATVNDLKIIVSEKETLLSELKDNFDLEKENTKTHENVILELKKQITLIEEQKEVAHEKINNLQQIITEMEESISNLRIDLQGNNENELKLTSAIDELQDQLRNKESLVSDMQENLISEQQNHAMEKSKMEELISNLNTKLHSNNEDKMESISLIDELQKKLIYKESVISDLEEKIISEQKENAISISTINKLKLKQEEMNMFLNKTTEKIELLEKEKVHNCLEIENLKTSIDSNVKIINDLEIKLLSFKAKEEDLNSIINALKSDIVNKKEELNDKDDQMRTSLNLNENLIADLKSQNKLLEKKLIEKDQEIENVQSTMQHKVSELNSHLHSENEEQSKLASLIDELHQQINYKESVITDMENELISEREKNVTNKVIINQLEEKQEEIEFVLSKTNEKLQLLEEEKVNNHLEIEKCKTSIDTNTKVIRDFEIQLVSIKAKEKDLNTAIDSLKSDILNKEKELSKMYSQLVSEQQQKESYANKIDQMKTSMNADENLILDLKNQIKLFEENLVEKDSKIDELQFVIKEKEFLLSQLKNDLSHMNIKEIKLNEEINELKSKIIKKDMILDDNRMQLDVKDRQLLDHEELIIKMKKENEMFNSSLEGKNEIIAELQKDKNEKDGRIDKMEDLLREKEEILLQLKNEKSSAIIELDELKANLVDTEKSIVQIQGEITSLRQVISELDENKNQLNIRETTYLQRISNLEDNVSTLENDMNIKEIELNEEINELKIKIIKKDMILDDNRMQLDVKDRQLLDHEELIIKMKKENEMFNSSLEEKNEIIAELQKDKNEKDRRINKMEDLLREKEEILLQLKNEKSSAIIELDELKANLVDKEKSIVQIQGEITSLRQVISELDENKNQLNIRETTYLQRISNLEDNVSTLENDKIMNLAEIKSLKDLINEKEATKVKFVDEFKTVKDTLKSYTSTIAELKSSNENKELIISELRNELAILNLEKSELQKQADILRDNISTSESELVKYKSDLSAHMKYTEHLNKEIDLLKSLLEERESSLLDNKKEHLEKHEQIDNYKQIISNQESLIKTLETEKLAIEKEKSIMFNQIDFLTNNSQNQVETINSLKKQIVDLKEIIELKLKEIDTITGDNNEQKSVLNKSIDHVLHNITLLSKFIDDENSPIINTNNLSELIQIETNLILNVQDLLEKKIKAVQVLQKNKICKMFSNKIVINNRELVQSFNSFNCSNNKLFEIFQELFQESLTIDDFNQKLQKIISNFEVVETFDDIENEPIIPFENIDVVCSQIGLLILIKALKIRKQYGDLKIKCESNEMQNSDNQNDENMKQIHCIWETFTNTVHDNLKIQNDIENLEKNWLDKIDILNEYLNKQSYLNDDMKQLLMQREDIETKLTQLRWKATHLLHSNLSSILNIFTPLINDTFPSIEIRRSEIQNYELPNCGIKKIILDHSSLQITEKLTFIDEISSIIKNIHTFYEYLKKCQQQKISSKNSDDKENIDLKQIHDKYEGKLEKMKEKLKSAYTEQVTKLKKEQEAAAKEKIANLQSKLEYQCYKHQGEINKYKKHVSELTSQLWDVGEKLLIEKQHKEEFQRKIQDLKLECDTFQQRLECERSIDPHLYQQKRSNIQGLQLMGNAFKVEDEEGEIFDTTYLSDIDKHRNSFSTNDISRLSILQMRNSKCRPHLKSSYPAETQFNAIDFSEEEIKNGNTADDIFNDSLSQSLLTGKRVKGKERSRMSYKKPGPPTPNRSNARLSLTGIITRSPTSRILREQNNIMIGSKSTKNNLTDSITSKRSDENTLDTPRKSRRFSNLFRKNKVQNDRK